MSSSIIKLAYFIKAILLVFLIAPNQSHANESYTNDSHAYEGRTYEEKLSNARQNELTHLVKQDCGSCHGMTLKGGLGPALLVENLQNKPVLFIQNTILYGRPGTAMPPWKTLLTEQEALWIAVQLKQGNISSNKHENKNN
tara:strand:+ start:113901 stop:114323 length:423 start_codon:yes stop_codon:yes gene_type:complete